VNFTAYNTLALNIRSSDYVNISHSILQGQGHAGQSMVNISDVQYLDLSFCNFAAITSTLYSPVLIFNDVYVTQIFWCSMRNISTGSDVPGNIIVVQSAANIQIESSTFNENSVIGLIAVDNINITSSTFNDNYCGVIVELHAGNVYIVASVFVGNTFFGHGGYVIELYTADYVHIVSSTFDGNTFSGSSGKVIGLSATDIVDNINITSSTFNDNNINNGVIIELHTAGNVYIVASAFVGNTFFGSGGYVVVLYTADYVHIVSSTFDGNTGIDGTVIGLSATDIVYIAYSTFSNNFVDGSDCLICIYGSDAVLFSCSTIRNNTVGYSLLTIVQTIILFALKQLF
jgi:hypothetical protein